MTRFLKALLLPILFLGVTLSIQAQDSVTFRYKWGKDDKLIYLRTQTTNQNQTVMNQEVKTTIDNSDLSVWTVKGKDAKGNYEIETENKSMKANVEIGPLGKYSFDSKKNDNDKGSTLGAALTPIYERMSGSTMTLVVSPQGEVHELRGFKELMQDVLKDNPLGAQFTGGGSEKAAKFGFSEYFPKFSDKAIRPGETWETKFEMELPKIGKAQGKRIYRYEGNTKVGKKELAKIQVSTEMAFDIDLTQNGAKVTGNLSISKSNGNILFDVQKGEVESLNNQYTISGILNVSVNGMDIQVGTEQNQNVTMKLLEKLPQ